MCRDYFSHLDPRKFIEKASKGEIDIPLTRIDPSSQKSAKGVHLQDLADYIDKRRAAAQKEIDQLMGRR